MKQRIPENYFVFGLSRQIQWSNTARPADNAGVTSIEPPNKIITGLIKDWFGKSNLDTLIARVESEFVKENSEFKFWLDSQRYLVQSLEKKGGTCKAAAEDVKVHLAKLIDRIPDLPQLKFRDKQTPFADADTINWIEDEVKSVIQKNGTTANNSHPPIVGEDYDKINKQYQVISTDPLENFEKNLSAIQTSLNTEESRKGKFLWRLNLADYYYRNKEYNLARINLLELKEKINSYNLVGWEQALCTAVWRILFLTNKEILDHTKDESTKKKIESEQEELFHEIGKYDGVLALKLTKQKK